MLHNKEMVGKYRALYVEDEDTARHSITLALSRLGFKELLTAKDGLEGLEIYKKEKPDIVISDIQMPRMTGLEMVSEILLMNPEAHIIFTTAFSDQEYLIQAIELKVDRYILKPIDISKLMDAIFGICVAMEQKKLITAYKLKEQKEKLELALKDATKLIVNANPNPIIVFKNRELSFINDSFIELLSHKDLEPIDRAQMPDIFEKREGYLCFLDEFKKDTQNKVCIKNASGRDKIYEVKKRELAISTEFVEIFFLIDITLLEYQRRKLQTFGNAVQKELISKRYKESGKDRELPVISDTRKISASEYASEVDGALFEQLEELRDLEFELYDDVALLNERKEISHLAAYADRISRYSQTMKMLFEFAELSFAIKNISELLYTQSSTLDPHKLEAVASYCGAIVDDLSSWRNTIFVEKSAIDIHYLDDSLYSSCLQLEFLITGVEAEDDGGDLELF